MGIYKATIEHEKEIDESLDKATKAFEEFLIKTFKEVKEQEKILSELLGRMHNFPPEDFNTIDICRAYSFLMNITPASRKIREPSVRKGGDEV